MNLTIYKILLVITILVTMVLVPVLVPHASLAAIIIVFLIMMLGAPVFFPGKLHNSPAIVFLQRLAYPFALVYQRIHILLLRISRVSPELIENEKLRLKSIQRFPYDRKCAEDRKDLVWLANEFGWEHQWHCFTTSRESFKWPECYVEFSFEVFEKNGHTLAFVFHRGITSASYQPRHISQMLMINGQIDPDYVGVIVVCPDDVYEDAKKAQGDEPVLEITKRSELGSVVEFHMK